MSADYGPLWIEIKGSLKPDSAFRVGAPSALDMFSDMPVLRIDGRHGRPWIPGSSLRGVLRSYLSREHSLLGVAAPAIEVLFGKATKTHTEMGRVRIFDSVADELPGTTSELRDHVRIEPSWGAAAERLKFDSEVVPKSGWHFPLRIVYEGPLSGESHENDLILLGEVIRALQNGRIRIGGRIGIGLGQFKLQEGWGVRRFDRSTASGFSDWLKWRLGAAGAGIDPAYEFPNGRDTRSESIRGLHPFHNLSFTFALRCEGPFLVKSPVKGDNPDVSPVKMSDGSADGSYYLPGSSLRGVLSAHAYRIADSQNTGPEPWQRLFGSVKGNGSGARGLLEVDDGVVNIEDVNPEESTVCSDHVAIDRITNAAAGPAKFDDKALNSPQIVVTLSVTFTDDTEDFAALALLLLALRDLLDANRRRLWAGSQTTRGYGLIRDATPVDIQGSFHGDLRSAIPADWVQDTSRAGRKDFSAQDAQTRIVFDGLCALFDKSWQAVRRRSIPA